MNISLQDRLIDFILDCMELISQAKTWSKNNKTIASVMFSCLILGVSSGFASAILLPTTLDSQLMLASLIDTQKAEEEKKAQTKLLETQKQAKKVEAEKTVEAQMSADVLQKIYTEVILQQKPELCEKQLAGKYINACKDNYWTIQASLQSNASLCDKVSSPEGKTACTQGIKAGNTGNGLSDEEIKQKSEACLKIDGEKNQIVCWNSIFLSVALSTGDESKCQSIKDANTQTVCTEKAQETKDEKIKTEAITAKDYAKCQTISNEKIQNTCKQEVIKTILVVSPTCDVTCVNTKATEFAVDKVDISICAKAATTEGKMACQDKTYAAIAAQAANSTYCDKLSSAAEQATCKGQVPAEKDKNPQVQLQVFKDSDRSFPSLGEALSNPLTANPYVSNDALSSSPSFTSTYGASVLDTLDNLTQTSVPKTEVCKFYTDEKMKVACEDSLVLQVAIPNKDITQCKYVKDQSTRDYCELEIVQGDAIRAANAAKQKCQSLSSESSIQKCLRSLGFFTEEAQGSSSLECLDYPNPDDRIKCMRTLQTPSSTSTITPIKKQTIRNTDGIEEISSPDQAVGIIQDAIREIGN